MKIKKKRLQEIVNEELANFLNENMGTPKSGEESSIQTSLHMINEYSSKLMNIQDQVSWEDWMQDKLTIAARDLDSIYHKFEGDAGGEELASMNESDDPSKFTEVLDSLVNTSQQLQEFVNQKQDTSFFSPEQIEEIKQINKKLITLRSDIEAKLDRVDEQSDLSKKVIESFKKQYGDKWKEMINETSNKLQNSLLLKENINDDDEIDLYTAEATKEELFLDDLESNIDKAIKHVFKKHGFKISQRMILDLEKPVEKMAKMIMNLFTNFRI